MTLKNRNLPDIDQKPIEHVKISIAKVKPLHKYLDEIIFQSFGCFLKRPKATKKDDGLRGMGQCSGV